MRRTTGGHEPSFSLFPFLAVLLCTMGALVVLLVAMARVSRDQAELEAESQRAQATAQAQRTGLDQQLEKLDRATELAEQAQTARSEAAEALASEQLRLQGIEESIRNLRLEIESLQTEAHALFAVEEDREHDRQAAEQELERLNRLSEELTDEIRELEREAAARQRRYAIVPLRDDERGTHRPAIYFECREDGVVLQPEGVLFSHNDFAPPVEASSPLAAAVRAVKAYYAERPSARAAGEEGAPYPLLVVRPDGVEAYIEASNVLRAIDVQYGYQPVAEEWPLEYGEMKPELASRVAQAAELARLERERLALAAPQLFRPRPRFGSAVAGNSAGGRGNSPFSADRPDPDAINPFGAISGAVPGASSQRYASGTSGVEGQDSGNQNLLQEGTSETLAHESAEGALPGLGESGDPVGGGSGAEANSELEGDQPNAQQLAQQPNTQQQNSDSESAAAGASALAAGQPASEANQASSMQQGAGGQQGPSFPSESDPNAAAAASASAQFAPPQQGEGSAGAGRNSPSRPGIAIRRSIRLQLSDDLAVIGEVDPSADVRSPGKLENPVRIPLSNRLRQDWPEIVASLKQRAASWGIPGSGMYWKPVLQIDAAPGTESKAAALAEQFRASGIDARVENQAQAGLVNQGGDHATRR